jgi:hypothetical protein
LLVDTVQWVQSSSLTFKVASLLADRINVCRQHHFMRSFEGGCLKHVHECDVNILSKSNRLIQQSVNLLHNFPNFFLYSSLRIYYSMRDSAIFHGKNPMYCCLYVYVCPVAISGQ